MTSNRSTHEFLHSILQGSFSGIMAFKSIRNENDDIVDFEWTFVNQLASKLVGIPSDELVGSRLLDLLPGNKEAGLFDRYKEVVESRKMVTFEQFYPGEEINKWFKISAVHLEDGFTVNFQDISDLKEAMIESESRGKKYQKLFEESLDPIFLADEKFNVMESNDAFVKLFSSEKNLNSSSLDSLFALTSDFEKFHDEIRKSGKVVEFEADLLNQLGKKRPCLINCSHLIGENDKEKFFLGVVRDLTKRKRAERELILAEKISMTGKLSRTIGHEVRNPLTNLGLALDQLKDEVEQYSADVEIYFEIIERNLKRINNLINDLLDSSKPKELKLQKKSLNEVVQSSIALVRDRLNLRNLRLEENYDRHLTECLIDEDQLKVALLNLMINAIEAMEDGKGILSVKSYYEESSIYLEIEDNGIGIPKENLTKLFQPFFTSKKEGTGLGLVTVQNIIQSHRGEIQAESEVGKGTRFTMSFPILVED